MDYLAFLQKEIHAAAFATLAEDGRPEVRIIDIMLYDGHSLYFLTAKGKAFYRQLCCTACGYHRHYCAPV